MDEITANGAAKRANITRKYRVNTPTGLNASPAEVRFINDNANYNDCSHFETNILYVLSWVKAKYEVGEDVYTF